MDQKCRNLHLLIHLSYRIQDLLHIQNVDPALDVFLQFILIHAQNVHHVPQRLMYIDAEILADIASILHHDDGVLGKRPKEPPGPVHAVFQNLLIQDLAEAG